jgi:putative effector of murein hydrolase LrgA (UPF0299 family)
VASCQLLLERLLLLLLLLLVPSVVAVLSYVLSETHELVPKPLI